MRLGHVLKKGLSKCTEIVVPLLLLGLLRKRGTSTPPPPLDISPPPQIPKRDPAAFAGSLPKMSGPTDVAEGVLFSLRRLALSEAAMLEQGCRRREDLMRALGVSDD